MIRAVSSAPFDGGNENTNPLGVFGLPDSYTPRWSLSSSHGLAAMTQRMRAINGTLDIHSREGAGTRVEAFLPIAA